MAKFGPREGPCGWELRAAELELEELHQVLNCASGRGCNQCVRCSERALESFLAVAGKGRMFGFIAVERLELDMDFSAAFGL
ncbi:MAG: hypothetical protein EPN20_15980 [Magnetospirillum sp.]|nr:MAG: hypothetical protein EPN20_15980 [Magnetospirillum sp.]